MSKNNLVKSLISEVKTHWKKPAKGNFVGYKEIVSLSGGGIGVKTVNSMGTYIQLNTMCLLMGSVYGFTPSQLLTVFVISNIIGILKAPLASWLVDNTNTKWGKFRPYLLWAGIPCLIGVLGICFFIPEGGNSVTRIVLLAVFFNIYSIGQQLYNNAFMGLTQVISPNSSERSKIMSISEFVANLGPSIVQLLLPLLAQLFFGSEGMLDIRAYRVLLPIFCGVGFALGLVVMFMTEERIILPKSQKVKLKFIDGIRLVGRNKDFWIVTVSKFFGGFKGQVGLLLGWICMYQIGQTSQFASALFGIIPTIVSVAFIPGMLIAPLLMKKFGHGKSSFISFFMNALAGVLMALTFKKGVIFFVIALFVYNFASGPQYIMQTTITADALDEIQLESKKRVEGFAQNFQQIFEIIGNIAAQFLFILVYNQFGLVAGTDGKTDYSVLVDANVREPIILWIIIIAVAASVLSALPFLLCKMTYARHDVIVEKLEKRKFFDEKLECGEFSEAELEEMYQVYLAEAEEDATVAGQAVEKVDEQQE